MSRLAAGVDVRGVGSITRYKKEDRPVPFQVFVHTTKNLAAAPARWLVTKLAKVSEGPFELFVSAQDRWVVIELVSDRTLAEIHATGGFSLRAKSGVISVRVEWRRFQSQQELERFLQSSDHLRNLIHVAVEEQHLEGDEPSRMFLLAFAGILEAVEANYAIGYGGDASRYDTDFGSPLGLSGGLRDAYPLNFFGPPFVDLIGRQHLLEAPADVVRELSGGVLILPSKEIWRYSSNMEEARERIRAHLGEEYFVAGAPRRAGVQVGGLLTMVRTLLEERRRMRARTPPSIAPSLTGGD